MKLDLNSLQEVLQDHLLPSAQKIIQDRLRDEIAVAKTRLELALEDEVRRLVGGVEMIVERFPELNHVKVVVRWREKGGT